MSHPHPFFFRTYNGRDLYDMTATDRLSRVGGFDLSQCRAALALPDLQTSVRTALERRVRKLEKAHATHNPAA